MLIEQRIMAINAYCTESDTVVPLPVVQSTACKRLATKVHMTTTALQLLVFFLISYCCYRCPVSAQIETFGRTNVDSNNRQGGGGVSSNRFGQGNAAGVLGPRNRQGNLLPEEINLKNVNDINWSRIDRRSLDGWTHLYPFGEMYYDLNIAGRPWHDQQIDLDFFFPYYGFRFNYTFIFPEGFIAFSFPRYIQPPYSFPNPRWPEEDDMSFIAAFMAPQTTMHVGEHRISNLWYRIVHRPPNMIGKGVRAKGDPNFNLRGTRFNNAGSGTGLLNRDIPERYYNGQRLWTQEGRIEDPDLLLNRFFYYHRDDMAEPGIGTPGTYNSVNLDDEVNGTANYAGGKISYDDNGHVNGIYSTQSSASGSTRRSRLEMGNRTGRVTFSSDRPKYDLDEESNDSGGGPCSCCLIGCSSGMLATCLVVLCLALIAIGIAVVILLMLTGEQSKKQTTWSFTGSLIVLNGADNIYDFAQSQTYRTKKEDFRRRIEMAVNGSQSAIADPTMVVNVTALKNQGPHLRVEFELRFELAQNRKLSARIIRIVLKAAASRKSFRGTPFYSVDVDPDNFVVVQSLPKSP